MCVCVFFFGGGSGGVSRCHGFEVLLLCFVVVAGMVLYRTVGACTRTGVSEDLEVRVGFRAFRGLRVDGCGGKRFRVSCSLVGIGKFNLVFLWLLGVVSLSPKPYYPKTLSPNPKPKPETLNSKPQTPINPKPLNPNPFKGTL